MHRQHHRGPDPEDPGQFTVASVAVLQRAAADVNELLSRGYPMPSAVAFVGDHHQLTTRQRLALRRGCCSDEALGSRRGRRIDPGALRGRALWVDGFNVLVTLEVALGGGLVLVGREGCARDLAGLRGSYHPVDDTDRAIDLVCEMLGTAGVSEAKVLLDAPVSNSGRLRARIESRAPSWLQVVLAADPDRELIHAPLIATSDGPVLDACSSWFDLARTVVDRAVPNAWRVSLQDGQESG